jgi:hypothetical protein
VKGNSLHNESGACDVSLYSRLIGPEISVPYIHNVDIDPSLNNNIDSYELCWWKLVFPPVLRTGEYRLEILSMWINELDEPDDSSRQRGKLDRRNDGSIIHLGGMVSFVCFFYLLVYDLLSPTQILLFARDLIHTTKSMPRSIITISTAIFSLVGQRVYISF